MLRFLAHVDAANKFLEAMRRGRPASEKAPESVADYWIRHRRDWNDDLSKLRASIRTWLGPLILDSAVTVKDVDFSTTEPDLGQYMAPGLTIDLLTDPPKSVDVRPRGARVVGIVETGGHRVVGASGRVDLECELRREIVLRFREKGETCWRSFGGGKKVEVDQKTFFALLGRVTNIDLGA